MEATTGNKFITWQQRQLPARLTQSPPGCAAVDPQYTAASHSRISNSPENKMVQVPVSKSKLKKYF
jgi:hypothetical protein